MYECQKFEDLEWATNLINLLVCTHCFALKHQLGWIKATLVFLQWGSPHQWYIKPSYKADKLQIHKYYTENACVWFTVRFWLETPSECSSSVEVGHAINWSYAEDRMSCSWLSGWGWLLMCYASSTHCGCRCGLESLVRSHPKQWCVQ